MATEPVEVMEAVGVVLAGGRSRRMGRSKAGLPWVNEQGQRMTWLVHAVQRLQAVCETVVVSGRPAQALPEGVASVSDAPADSGRGPLAGISAVLTAYPDQVCVFLPVDMVRVPPQALVALGQSRSMRQPHAAYADSLFPLCLKSTDECRQQVQALLSSEAPQARSVQALIARLGYAVGTLEPERPEQLINANCPQDLTRFQLPTGLDGPAPKAAGSENQTS